MKKVLSLVLVIAMILSSMSFAFAANFEDVADTDYAKAIETLVALGVVTGYEDGTFRPENVVTRAEMAKLIVEILGYGDLVAGSKSNFTDTQGHWADAWIALAAGRGLVIGTGDGKFTPDRTVSYDEAITMVVRALGYTDASNEIKNMSWPTNFKIKAAELGLTKDVSIKATGADRGGVAQLLYNALTATLVTVNSDGDVIKSTTQTTDRDGKVVVEYTELLSRIADYDPSYVVEPDALDADSKNYAGDKVDLAPYMYQDLKAYFIDDEVVYVKGTNSVVLEGTVTDVLNAAGNSVVGPSGDTNVVANAKATLVVEDADEKETDITVPAISGSITDNSVKVFYNGEEQYLGVDEFEALLYDNSAAKVTVIVNDRNDDGKANNGEAPLAIVAQKATSGILVKNDYVEGKTKISGVNASITLPDDDGDVDLEAITVTGEVDSLEEISEDDIVVAYAALSGDLVKLVVSRNTVEGTVTKTTSDSMTVYVDGTKYTVSKVRYTIGANAIDAGDKGIFYLDDAGKIFAADTDSASPTDYAIVLNAKNGKVAEGFTGEFEVDSYAQIKLLTMNDETVTYNVLTSFDGDELDDKATLDVTGSLVSVPATLVDGATITLAGAITKGALVRYSLDDDGFIDAIETVATIDETSEMLDSDEIEDIVTEDTVVFYHNTIADEYSVVSTKSVKDGTATVVYYNSGSNKGKIAVILTTNAASANDGTYGVIKAVNYVTNSSKDKVVEVTALVNGEEVKFLTRKDVAINGTTLGTTLAKTVTAQAIKFGFNSSDVLTSIVVAPDDANVDIYSGAITEITSNNMNIGGTVVRFASDCAVYIYDLSDKAWTIGDISDLDEGLVNTRAYATDVTNSSRINIVVQVQP